jgi:hypothetical protein
VAAALAPAPLRAIDRCDRCGAQAYVRAVLSSGELLFCVHHSREYEEALRAMGADLLDESDRLDSQVLETER